MELKVNQETLETLVKGDIANVTMLRLLVMCLEREGVLREGAFMAFLDDFSQRVDASRDAVIDPVALELLKTKIEMFRSVPDPQKMN